MYSANICGHQMDQEFGYYHVGHDNASPEVQSTFTKIMGMNGHLDLSEQDGAVFFDSVSREWRFEKVTKTTSVDDVDGEAMLLRNKFLGVEGKTIFDSDPEFYYFGRITKIDVSCEDGGRLVAVFYVYTQPFRMKCVETVVSAEVGGNNAIGSKLVGLSNLYMPVTPYITTSAQMTLDYTIKGQEYQVTIPAGTTVIDTLVLFGGITMVSVYGNGTISFKYRQGAF